MASNRNRSILVMGEALIDLVIDPRREDPEPIAVPGGSPANVALALSRLGLDVELVAWFGQDKHGEMIREHLEASDVKISQGSDGAAFTPTAEAHLDHTGAATYVFNLEWDPKAPVAIPEDAAVVHTGSIGAVLAPGTDAILEAFTRARSQAMTTYDPNARPTLMGDVDSARKIIESFVEQSDVVKVSDEDLLWLYPDQAPEDSALAWTNRFNVPLIVVTRGKQGPVAWTATGAKASVIPAKVKVVDTVGAGDTFMGGLIDALWRRDLTGVTARKDLLELSADDLVAIIQDASEVADVVVQRRGANPPWAHELGR